MDTDLSGTALKAAYAYFDNRLGELEGLIAFYEKEHAYCKNRLDSIVKAGEELGIDLKGACDGENT